jgi:hypothetical protein
LFAGSQAYSQNLESIGKEKPLSITGGISANQIFYKTYGIDSRRDPYSYYLSGNVNFSLYGWNVPLSFSFSNQNTSFSQPFNRYSVHPMYKWITGHFGYTSMSFSPYSVNGHVFLGAGIDVAPEGKWKLSALYGRFLKAVEMDTTKENVKPAYKRMGYGVKAGYGNGGNFADLIIFHAQDEINSIRSIRDTLSVLPEENLVISIAAGKTFFDHFVLKSELAASALSRDSRISETNNDSPLAKAHFLYKPRLSSSYYKAFKTSFDYQLNGYTIGVAYERIDPQYRTLGAYYFNSDLENITANGSAAILEGRMNVAMSMGIQRDNLGKSKISTMRRTVGSVNVSYMPSQKLNFSGSYSTFQSYTNIRSQFVNINQLTPFDNLDTLKFTQLSSNATLSSMYSFGRNEQRKQNLNLNLTYQKAADKQGNVQQNSGMQFYNVNIAYAVSIVPQNMTVSVSLNSTLNEGAGMSSKIFGPTAAVNKSFFDKKLRTTLSTSYNNTFISGENVNTIINVRLNGSLTLQKKHAITLSLVRVSRDTKTESSSKSFSEYTGTLGYSYAFGIK